MKLSRKLLVPVLGLSSLFCGVAGAQDVQKDNLPEAPAAKVQQPGQPVDLAHVNWSLPPERYRPLPYEYHARPFPQSSNDLAFLGDGKIGKLATYFNGHTNDAQFPYDFAMEYPLTSHISLQGGTLVNMANNTGKAWSDRFLVRQMTGLPDWQTRGLRDAMFGAPLPDYNHGNDGYGVGFKIYFGHKR